MNNASNLPGYLTPTRIMSDYDDAFERSLSQWIQGVSGLPPNRVFSRWRDRQNKNPPAGASWCAFDVIEFALQTTPAFVAVNGANDAQWWHEEIKVIAGFYGAEGQRIASQFRGGIFVQQNNEMLNAAGMTFCDVGSLLRVSEYTDNQWQCRYDVTVTLCRKVISEYHIQSLAAAPVTFFKE